MAACRQIFSKTDWNHDGDNHATDGDEDGFGDLGDSDPRNPALWIDWNHDGYNDGSEPPDRDGDGIFDNARMGQESIPDSKVQFSNRQEPTPARFCIGLERAS